MRFSILIANYNNAKYFKDCFESIIGQSYSDWEAIVLDDGSTEEDRSLLKSIINHHPQFRYYENEKNSGVGITKSKLIELAKGEVCVFLDPDDAMISTSLENHARELSKDSSIAFTYSRLIKCDEFLKPLHEMKSAAQVRNFDPYFFNCPIKIAPLVCFRKSVYDQTSKMDSYFNIAEDQDIYLKMYELGKVKYIDSADYYYRGHSGGVSQNQNKQKSYDYWAECIWRAMKRRGLKEINGQKIPEQYTTSKEIFDLLAYQNKLPYRIKNKILVFFQNLFQ